MVTKRLASTGSLPMLSCNGRRFGITQQYHIACVNHHKTLCTRAVRTSCPATDEIYRIGPGSISRNCISPIDLITTSIAIEVDRLVPA
jgi:hypothetical protein